MSIGVIARRTEADRSLPARVRRSGLAGIIAVVLIIGVPLVSVSHMWLYVINGISDGAIYSLAAIGLVLTYKTSGIFNFAIGAQAALSAYLFYTFRVTERLPWPLAALLALLIAGVVASLLLEKMATWLSEAPAVLRVVATIGLLVLLQSALTGAYGQATLPFSHFLPTAHFRLAGINIQAGQIIVVALAFVATGGLYVFFKRTRIGVAMQAVVDDPNLLALQATDPAMVRRYAWVIGSCFVSISGMLIAPEIGIDVKNMLLLYITAFGAAALGAFTSLPATLASAIGIGVLMNVMSYKLAGQHNAVLSVLYTQVPFIVLVLALLFVPKQKLVERGIRRVRKFPPIPTFPLPVVLGAVVGGIALAVALPSLVGMAYINIYTTAVGFAVVLASLGLIVWTSGQISLCHVAFAAVGAATLAHAQAAGIPWVFGLVAAGLVSVPVGAIVAIPSFRLSGVYLAVATFAFGLLFQNLLYTTFLMFGGSDTQPVHRPLLFGLHTNTDTGYFYVSAVVAAGCLAIIIAVRRSRLGQLLRALSDSPAALDAHGANTRLTRLLVFCISAFLAGIGGALIAGVTQFASGSVTGPFSYFNALALVAILAFCRRQPILSPLIAAFLFEVLKVYKPFTEPFFQNYEGVVFGLLAIAVAVGPALKLRSTGKRVKERTTRSPVKDRVGPAVLVSQRAAL
jgi:branched-subunit amino acid ABC-type transport system permease component